MSTGRAHIVAIIPARYASVRLPAKPLIDLCGKPMIRHVYERAQGATLVGRVLVATDHEEIARVVRSFGGEAVMTPPELRSGTDRIAWVARTLDDAAIIVNVQGDEPLIAPRMIDEAIAPLLADATVEAATLVKKVTTAEELQNPGMPKVVLDAAGNAIYFSRSIIPHMRDIAQVGEWLLHHTYYKHIGLYVYRRDLLLKFAGWEESALEKVEKLEQLRLLERGYRMRVSITEFDSMPVDTPADAEQVRQVMMEHNAQHKVTP